MSDRDEKLREVVELTSRLADEQLDAADVARLESLLFGDPEACELYLNVTTLHAHLSHDFGGAVPTDVRPFGPASVAAAATAAPPSHASARTIRFTPSTRWRPTVWRTARYAAAASVVLFVGVVSVWAVRSRAEPADACATLIEVRGPGVAWAECSHPHAAGDRLGPQTIGLDHGTAVVRFDNGAVATLTAPFELLVESRRSAELKRGSILVRSDREQSGFTLKTAASDFVDLGTEFGVTANADASSEVHVFQGVVITRPRASDAVVPVLGSEAGRVDAERGDVVAIDANPARFPGVTTASPAGKPFAAAAGGSRPHGPLPRDARVVFVGDRATDMETHLLLVSQALAKLYPDGPRPRLFNAGGTIPLAYAEADLRRQVLAHRATHAVIEFGPEIAASPDRRPADRFEREVRALATRLVAEGVEPILATGFPLGERQAQCQGVLDEYTRALRRVAADGGYRLADVDA
ncbi:MAG: FecR protein, partial [Phycisphaerales bacterium]|nr:FecR protein [Phycisphaerales bacterium]